MERFLAEEQHRALAPSSRRLLATALPLEPAGLSAYQDGVVWLATGREGAGLALYCDAHPLGLDQGWEMAARAVRALTAEPRPALALIASLRRHGRLASVALEGSGPADLRFKLYFRLQRPMALRDLANGFDDPLLLDFIGRVIEERRPRLSGLVLSASVRLEDGALADTKVDLCACPACGARPAGAWSDLLAGLGRAYGFPTTEARAAAEERGLEVALIGLAQRGGCPLRLNTYFAPRLEHPSPRQRLRVGLERGVAFLLRSQASDGHFEDYELPVGASDQWVTALAGATLAEIHAQLGLAGTRDAAERAAGWLRSHRASPSGWGFNERTGPDADSTAHAVLLFRALDLPVESPILDALEARWRPAGGFATYDRADAWGAGHPCVTPVVFAALHAAGRPRLLPEVLAYLRRMQQPDGTWPSYWWTTPRYAEYATLRLLRTLGLEDWARARAAECRTYPFQTCLELACALGAEAIRSSDPHVLDRIGVELLRHQREDGGWPGGPDLRVTAPDCDAPWHHPAGQTYCDVRSLLTTSLCLRALADCWRAVA